MSIRISCAPCFCRVDDPKNPYLPDWKLVLDEAGKAGYKGIELGQYGYLPLHIQSVQSELEKNDLTIIAGTIFDDLVSESNLDNLVKQVHDICLLITKLKKAPQMEGQNFPTPYLVIIDWEHEEREYAAGHQDRAPRLPKDKWGRMVDHIKTLAKIAWEKYGVRSVIHPHAGGYIEFADEINKIVEDIPYETAGLCLDTGHLAYSKMDPVEWLKDKASHIDYIHFKDIDENVYQEVMGEHIKFFDACAKMVMCPIGKGNIDYDAVKNVLEDINYHGYITIEQERDPRNSATSLRDVSESLNYLKSLGY